MAFDGCPSFGTIISALQTPSYKLAKFLVPILKPLITNKYTVKDTFNSDIETVEQDSSNFMGSLGIDSHFTNILLEETMEICTNNLFKNNDIVHVLKKNEFKHLLSLATKEPYFIFSNILYKKIDKVTLAFY